MYLQQSHDVSDEDCKKYKVFKVNIHILGLFLTLEDGHCIPVLEEDVPSHTREREE